VDQEVAKTLGELELKLAELERELTSIGRRQEHSGESAGRLIDEAVEQGRPVEWEPPPEAFAREPQTPVQAERQSIDLAELVRFRDKLKGTMDELIDEYGRLLSLSPPSPPRSDT